MASVEVNRRTRRVLPAVLALALVLGMLLGYFDVGGLWGLLVLVVLIAPTVAWVVWPLRNERRR